MRTVLIDADSILYIVGWQNREHGDEHLVMKAVDEFMKDIVATTGAEAYLGVFSPKKTFRNEISPEYKAKRAPIHPGIAQWKDKILQYCITEYGFTIADGIEADDVLSILGQTKDKDYEWILAHIDKDLRQIPGTHYNYSKKTWEEITEAEAERIFWTQVLVGDTTDNVKGAWKIGPVKAKKLLDDYQDYDGVKNGSYDWVVKAAFERQNGETWKEDYELAVQLIQLVLPVGAEFEVENYRSKIQMVKFEDESGLVTDLLNDNRDRRVLSDSERSHEGDVLCPPSDFSKQV